MDNLERIGLTTAKAMERLERLVADGAIPADATVGACYCVVALDYPTPSDAPDRELLHDTTSTTFVFGDPEIVYVQIGVLNMALDNLSELD